MASEIAIRLGARGSALAQAQAHWVADRLREHHPELTIEQVVVRTTADRAPHLALSEIGDKGLWVEDLERQLLEGQIDLAVHSMKDLPAKLADGLALGVVPERECPLDALVLPQGIASAESPGGLLQNLSEVTSALRFLEVQQALDGLLPPGARIGTSSERRRGQLLLWRPDLQISPIRGNVDTRLRKLDSGEFDALVLAAAGLHRLGLKHRITAYFPARRLTPAAGQGALALEIRSNDSRMRSLLTPLNHNSSAAAVAAERSFVRSVGGGCSVPLGVYTSFPPDALELWVRAVPPQPASLPPYQDLQMTLIPDEPDPGSGMHAEANPFLDPAWAVELGERMADRFLRNGGSELLALYRSREEQAPRD